MQTCDLGGPRFVHLRDDQRPEVFDSVGSRWIRIWAPRLVFRRLTVIPAGQRQLLSSRNYICAGSTIVPPLNDDYIRRAIAEFRDIDPKYIIVGHCTGDRFYDLARAELGDRVIHSAVGTRFVFTGGL